MKNTFKNNWIYYLGAILIIVIILYEARGEGDFKIFIDASKDLLKHKNIYQIKYNEWYHYYYDILFALLLVPFTFFPLYIVKSIWLILNIFFVYRIWKIITGFIPLILLSKRYNTIFTILSFIFILSFLRDNFHLAQLTIFIMYLSLEGIHLINKQKRIRGSILIALGINIKLLPIVIIPYLLYRNEWKSVFFIIFSMIVFLFLPVLVIGMEYNNFLLIERWHLLNPMNKTHVLDTSERSFHSISTLLATLLVNDCGDWHALKLRRNIAHISLENLNIIINFARGLLIIFTLYFLGTKPFKKITEHIQKLYELSYLFLIVPLIFPHQQHYSFFFIFPASTYLIFYFIHCYISNINHLKIKYYSFKKITFIVFFSIIFFLTNSRLILGQFNEFYDHYKTLTYGVLMLLILLAINKPKKIIRKINDLN